MIAMIPVKRVPAILSLAVAAARKPTIPNRHGLWRLPDWSNERPHTPGSDPAEKPDQWSTREAARTHNLDAMHERAHNQPPSEGSGSIQYLNADGA